VSAYLPSLVRLYFFVSIPGYARKFLDRRPVVILSERGFFYGARQDALVQWRDVCAVDWIDNEDAESTCRVTLSSGVVRIQAGPLVESSDSDSAKLVFEAVKEYWERYRSWHQSGD
jgi:hypothetical protein